MPEKIMPAVTVMLDKERHFLVSMGALLRFKKESGKDPLNNEVMTQIAEDLKAKKLTDDIFILFWASLRHEDKNLTIEQVEDMITPKNLQHITEKFVEAFGAAMPDKIKTEVSKEESPLAEKSPAG
jgi:RNA-binding protein YhbY